MQISQYIPQKRTLVIVSILLVLFVAITGLLSLDRHSPAALFFTDLTLALRTETIRPDVYINSIVVNTNPGDRIVCASGYTAYEFFVMLTNEKSFLQGGCLQNPDSGRYLRDINTYLTNSRGYPEFEDEDLATIPITIGDGKKALDFLGIQSSN